MRSIAKPGRESFIEGFITRERKGSRLIHGNSIDPGGHSSFRFLIDCGFRLGSFFKSWRKVSTPCSNLSVCYMVETEKLVVHGRERNNLFPSLLSGIGTIPLSYLHPRLHVTPQAALMCVWREVSGHQPLTRVQLYLSARSERFE